MNKEEANPRKKFCMDKTSECEAEKLEPELESIYGVDNNDVTHQSDIAVSPACVQNKKNSDTVLETIANIVPHCVEALAKEEPVLELDNCRGQKRKLEPCDDIGEKLDNEDGLAVHENLNKEEMKVLVEEDVGITEFISSHLGFSGTIKQRYSDFIVNEVSDDGEVVHLTSLSIPDAAKTTEDTTSSTSISDLISEENIVKLQSLTASKSTSDEVFIPVGSDKEFRGRLHNAIKESFPDLDSNTIDKDGEKYIQIRFRSQKDSRRQTVWKKSTGEYCKFVLYKENKDTLEAINIIAKFLRVSPATFSFAGTKDRRAKTSQNVTAYRVEPHRLQNLNKCLRNIVLGNFRFCKQQLKLGDLLGNRFTILLRNVLGSDEEIEKGLTSLRDHGFINYYGMQRFGTTRIPTHHVGRALLCGNWSEAIDLILKPREGDKDEVAKARAVWWSTRNAEMALKELKNHHCMERKLLEGLKKHAKNDLVSALSWIPCKMRLMYIHAYQSYLWNRIVSRRLKRYGIQPVVGDLALQGRTSDESLEETVEGEGLAKNKQLSRPEPVEVTEENLSEFSITDVVLPLPGYDVRYPKNDIKMWYEELLKEDGMENFNFKSRVRDYSLPGGYRKMIVRPGHVSWTIIYYNDYQVPMVQGDLELMKNEETPATLTEGKFKAVKLELSLPSSSYATMALREVLKSGTSAAYHTTLNVT